QGTRENRARVANVEQRKTNEMIGAELGYRYVGSPVIWDEPGGPEHLFREYVPTTWPGARLPHVWLRDELVHRSPQRLSASEGGCSVHDAIGDGYTLLKVGGSVADTRDLERAMLARRAPFSVLTIDDDAPRAVYGCDLVLVRPDLHVVWRGNAAPSDPAQLAAVATGYADAG